MSETGATAIMAFLGCYMLIGALFAVFFIFLGGANRIDPTFKTAPLWPRLLLFWGAMALWPYLLLRWLGAARAKGINWEQNA